MLDVFSSGAQRASEEGQQISESDPKHRILATGMSSRSSIDTLRLLFPRANLAMSMLSLDREVEEATAGSASFQCYSILKYLSLRTNLPERL